MKQILNSVQTQIQFTNQKLAANKQNKLYQNSLSLKSIDSTPTVFMVDYGPRLNLQKKDNCNKKNWLKHMATKHTTLYTRAFTVKGLKLPTFLW